MAEPTEEIEHVAFNPQPLGLGGQSALERVASDWQRGGWALLRVVPHHPYESIAVFSRKADVSGSSPAEPECSLCVQYAKTGGPSHSPSPFCESGKRPHCTCDRCW